MAILIVGGSGYVGHHLLEELSKVSPAQDLAYTYHGNPPELSDFAAAAFCVDLVTGEGLEAIVHSIGNPRVVINCAAMSTPRACELDPDAAMAINVPRMLLKWMASLQHPPLLVHLSTDQVYEGTRQFYTEEDETRPVNVYGKSKVEAERCVRENWSNFVILRSSIIYGPQPMVPVSRSLPIQWMDDLLSHNRAAEFFDDEFRCPIFVKDVARIVELLIAKYATPSSSAEGILLNMGGTERLSRADMAEAVARARGFSSSLVVRVSSKSVDRGMASPADISMDVSRLLSVLGVSLRSFDQGVQLTL